MAAVAKFSLVGVTIQTRIGKTHAKLLPLAVDVYSLGIPHNRMAPEIKNLHVLGFHIVRGSHAFFGGFGFFGQHHFRGDLGFACIDKYVVEERSIKKLVPF